MTDKAPVTNRGIVIMILFSSIPRESRWCAMPSRLESSRKMLAIYFSMFDSECPIESTLADPKKAAAFCEHVRRQWSIHVDDPVIIAAMRNAMATASESNQSDQ